MASLIQQLIEKFIGLPEWQILLVTALLLLEGAIFTIFPEEVVICTLGILWSRGNVSFPGAWVAITIGLLPTNIFVVTIGRVFGMRILQRAPFRWFIDPSMVHEALAPVRKYGIGLALLTRFLPIVRAPIYFSIGISGFNPWTFVRSDVLASLVQIPLWLCIGRWMGTRAGSLMQAFQWVGMLFGGLLIGAALFRLAWGRRQKKKRRAQSKRST